MAIIEQLHADFTAIVQKLPTEEISLRNVAEEVFRKGLLLASASYFEKCLLLIIKDLVRTWGGDNVTLNEFVRIKALDRQYHTLFDWEKNNANKFFSLFGEDFKVYMTQRCRDDAGLADAIKAFMELGRERNRLVHQDFGNFPMEKTAEEIFNLYLNATRFVNGLNAHFSDYCGRPRVNGDQFPDSTPLAVSQCEMNTKNGAD